MMHYLLAIGLIFLCLLLWVGIHRLARRLGCNTDKAHGTCLSCREGCRRS